MVNAAGILSIRAEDTEMESSLCAGENAEQWLRATEKNSKREELWDKIVIPFKVWGIQVENYTYIVYTY